MKYGHTPAKGNTMSTRSMIARRNANGVIEGRYHHSDGYPSGLGRTLWALYHGHFAKDAGAMRKFLIDDHPAGWSTIVGFDSGCDFTQEPGFIEFHNPIMQAAMKSNYTMRVRPLCYCHGDRAERGGPLMQCDCQTGPSSTCEPLMIEWMYVIRDDGLEVWESIENPHGSNSGEDGYHHHHAGTVLWTDIEPNWSARFEGRY